jgi:hypothetical protein
MISTLTGLATLLLTAGMAQPPAGSAQPVTPPSVAAANASLRASGKTKAAAPAIRGAAVKRAAIKSGAPTAATTKPAPEAIVVGMPAMKTGKKPAPQ